MIGEIIRALIGFETDTVVNHFKAAGERVIDWIKFLQRADRQVEPVVRVIDAL